MEFPRPLTDEVVLAADFVITMGAETPARSTPCAATWNPKVILKGAACHSTRSVLILKVAAARQMMVEVRRSRFRYTTGPKCFFMEPDPPGNSQYRRPIGM